jgi:hypothetical protein
MKKDKNIGSENMTREQLLAKLPPVVRAQMPRNAEAGPDLDAISTLAKGEIAGAHGSVYKIAAAEEISAAVRKQREKQTGEFLPTEAAEGIERGFYYLTEGAGIATHAVEGAEKYDLISGKLAFRGKVGKSLEFNDHDGAGIDPVPFATVVKYSRISAESKMKSTTQSPATISDK